MANEKPRYFELHEHVGVESSHIVTETDEAGQVLEEKENPKADELAPLASESMLVAFPRKVEGGDVISDVAAITILPENELTAERPARIVPGTRVIETTDRRVSDALLANGKYQEIDQPESLRPRKPQASPSPSPAPAASGGQE